MDETSGLPRDFGPWRLERELGRGGMGIVYEATDRRLDRKVALKVLRNDLSGGARALERFRREAKACAQVSHENVVEVFGAEEVDGRPCYAMTLLSGRTLADLSAAGELPPRKELFRGLAAIADALQVIHDLGIVHRDVTPGNLMIEPDGRLLLADFGLARLAMAHSLTQTGEALGTPYYMSPEQALGDRNVDGRTDVYSLGATLYELLAGQRPFVADDTGGLLQKILKETPRPITDRVPDLPADVSRVVMKALEKRPDDRYQSAAAMRDDLLALAEGRPVSGRPVSPVVRKLRRHRKPLIAAALLLAFLAGYAVWQARRPATLELLSLPAATVVLDGDPIGTTPMELAVEPGEHDLVMRLPGFRDYRRAVNLEAGETRTIEHVLAVTDPRDPEAIELLASSFELPELPTRERTGSGQPRPSTPAGAEPPPEPVLTEDLCALITGQMPLPEGTRVVLEEDGEVLAVRGPDTKADVLTKDEFLDRLAGLKDGGQLKIRWSVPDGEDREQRATLVARVPEKVRREIEKLEAKLKEAEQDPQVLRELKSRVYLANGLPLAALREAWGLTREGRAGPHTQEMIRRALERLNPEDE